MVTETVYMHVYYLKNMTYYNMIIYRKICIQPTKALTNIIYKLTILFIHYFVAKKYCLQPNNFITWQCYNLILLIT